MLLRRMPQDQAARSARALFVLVVDVLSGAG
jgi:hypothetical protein